MTLPTPSRETNDQGGATSNRNRFLMGAGGLALFLLAGFIIITITNKDGTKTTIRVPEGVDTEVNAAPGSKVHITQTDSKPANATPSKTSAGWHGWPADAPKPAIAPFDAAQAKRHQEEWAAYLKVPVEYTNSIGMKFSLIPPGEFLMGSTPAEIEAALKDVGEDKPSHDSIKSEAPQHRVILTQPSYLGVTEVAQAEYEKVMASNPSHFTPTGMGKEAVAGLVTAAHPVEQVSWIDAAEFCAKLSQQERFKPFYFRAGEAITLLDGTGYRLPSEAEWEFSCRAGTVTKYWIGDKDEDLVRAGWIGANSGGRTHAAGELKANPFGLFDIHGNVWEWVQDGWDATYYGQFQEQPAINPSSPLTASQRVVRGGLWGAPASRCRSSARYAAVYPSSRFFNIGFRVSLPVDAVRQALKSTGQAMPKAVATTPSVPANTEIGWHGWPADAPKPAIAPFDAAQAKRHQEEWAAYLKVPVEYTNSIGMKFAIIPPGEFLMGSTQQQIDEAIELAKDHELYQRSALTEAPQHRVILTQPWYFSITETRQRDYEQVMLENPSKFKPLGNQNSREKLEGFARRPVENVAWNKAADFCQRLSVKEQLSTCYTVADGSVTTSKGIGYRLPTTAEWEYAARAGTSGHYFFGEDRLDTERFAWCNSNAGWQTHEVAQLLPNPFGLFDIYGNVTEWCEDPANSEWYRISSQKPAINPVAPKVLKEGVNGIRGGSFFFVPGLARSAYQDHCGWAGRNDGVIGFRVVLSVAAVREAFKTTGPKMTNDAGTTNAPRRNQTADPDRDLAELILTLPTPGSITIRNPDQPEGLRTEVASLKDLPSNSFRVTNVIVQSPGITDRELEYFGRVHELEHITMTHPDLKITDKGIEALSKSPLVDSLLTWNVYNLAEVTDRSIESFNRFRKLGAITFQGSRKLTDDGFRRLKLLEVTSIDLIYTKVTPSALVNAQRRFPRLNHLRLNSPSTNEDYSTITSLPLRWLQIATEVAQAHSAENIAKIGRMQSLDRLELDGVVYDKDVSHLRGLVNLKRLEFHNSPEIGDQTCAVAAELPKLEYLHLHGFLKKITDVGLQHLSRSKTLKNIVIVGAEFTDAGIEAFRKARPDVELTVDGTVYPSTAAPSNPKVSITQPDGVPSGTPLDLTPPAPLGTWQMGPEPPWFMEQPYVLKGGEVLPGLIERPARLAGLKRWNVDTVWSRGVVSVARYSPNGKWLATGATDGHVRIYDAETMQLNRLLPGMGFTNGVFDLSWHPENELLVAMDGTGTSRIYSRTGTVVFEGAVQGGYNSVAWRPDGKQIAAGGNHAIQLLNPDGTIAKTLVEGFNSGCVTASLAWSPDHQRLASWHVDGKVRVWDVATGQFEILAEGLANWYPGYRLAWGSKDWIALADGEKLRLYNPERKMVQSVPYTGYVAAWHPDGVRVLMPHQVWDCEKNKVVGVSTNTALAVRFRQTALACSPDGQRLVGAAGLIRVQTSDFTKTLFETPATFAPITALSWSNDGQRLGSVSDYPFDQGVRSWSVNGKANSYLPLPKADLDCSYVLWSPDNRSVLASGSSGVWLTQPPAPLRRILAIITYSIAWSPNGQHFAVGTTEGQVLIMDRTGELVAEIKAGTGPAVLAWSKSTNLLAVHCGQQLLACDPQVGWTLKPLVTDNVPAPAINPIWSPDGEQISILNGGWYTRDGKRVADTSRPLALSWRSDGKKYLSRSDRDAGIDLNLPSGANVGHRAWNGALLTYSVVWHPRGHLITTGCFQGAITAWDASNLQPHWHAVLLPEQKSATFSGAGELLDGDATAIEKYLVYYVEREDGKIETLKPSEFNKLHQ